jgi:hypothetical protein
MRASFGTALTALCFAIGLSGAVSADTWRNPDHNDRRPPDRGWERPSDPQKVSNFVPLDLESGRPITVEHVYMNVGGKVLGVSARPGVERNNQNRLGWDRAPHVGHLAEHRYHRRDFDRSRILGEAYYEKGVVWFDLSEEGRRSRYDQVVFLNRDFAYRLIARPERERDVRVPKRPPGREIGKIYRGEDGELLVLVRPFIVTDSKF